MATLRPAAPALERSLDDDPPVGTRHRGAVVAAGLLIADLTDGIELGASMIGTPARVVRALEEATRGYQQDPKAILAATFERDGYDEIVALVGIRFYSTCEHHLLPFFGHASVAYLPGDRVVGLSKLARLVDCYARRFQIQERLTQQVADALQAHLVPRGVAVVLEGQHLCMMARGVAKEGATMRTSSMLGVFRDKPEARNEVLALFARPPAR